MRDRANITIADSTHRKSHNGFRLTYLHLIVADFKCQGHANLNCKNLINCDREHTIELHFAVFHSLRCPFLSLLTEEIKQPFPFDIVMHNITHRPSEIIDLLILADVIYNCAVSCFEIQAPFLQFF